MSIGELARWVGLSKTRLCALFKSDIGLTPKQYVEKIKMAAAAEMLRNSYKRVAEIAAELEFDSDSYFTRVFKKTYGQTPTEYRKGRQRRSEREDTAKNTASP
jgi:AraC-like DNA-binding protein